MSNTKSGGLEAISQNNTFFTVQTKIFLVKFRYNSKNFTEVSFIEGSVQKITLGDRASSDEASLGVDQMFVGEAEWALALGQDLHSIGGDNVRNSAGRGRVGLEGFKGEGFLAIGNDGVFMEAFIDAGQFSGHIPKIFVALPINVITNSDSIVGSTGEGGIRGEIGGTTLSLETNRSSSRLFEHKTFSLINGSIANKVSKTAVWTSCIVDGVLNCTRWVENINRIVFDTLGFGASSGAFNAFTTMFSGFTRGRTRTHEDGVNCKESITKCARVLTPI